MEKILFIHGLNCTGKIFTHIRSELPEHEAQIVEYDSHQAIERSLQEIVESVDRQSPFWIIGHSLGGIIGYLIAARKERSLKIKGLVSISTPFGGSSTAGILRWFFVKMDVLRDLSPSSAIVKEVTTQKIKIPFVSIISVDGSLPFISGENDGIVTLESQRASLSKQQVTVPANHFEIMQDDKTIATIKNFIFK